MNEGNRRLRDYYQRLGYFDVKVNHQQQSSERAGGGRSSSMWTWDSAATWRVSRSREIITSIPQTLKELLSVHAADSLDRHGAYSQALVSADVSALQAVYRNNGFSNVKVTPETSTPETSAADNSATETSTVPKAPAASQHGPRTASLDVIYRIEEGTASPRRHRADGRQRPRGCKPS